MKNHQYAGGKNDDINRTLLICTVFYHLNITSTRVLSMVKVLILISF